MNFFEIMATPNKNGVLEVYPNFQVGDKDSDLMIRGKKFYAIWDEEEGIWSTDESDVVSVVDKALKAKKAELESTGVTGIKLKTMRSYASGSWDKYISYVSKHPNRFRALDDKLTFADTEVKRSDLASKRLGYSLKKADHNAYDEIMSVLYAPKERNKLEWAIGSIISGDSRSIQKFFVLYGKGGTGKGTFLKILGQLFEGYTATFVAKDLASNTKDFSMETFSTNPLVAIDEDGDLSRIEDSTRINSIVSHERILINEKGKPHYPYTPHCMLFIGSNEPVKIKNAESGLIRRLIDIEPTGNRIPAKKYGMLMDQIQFELGGIAEHCLQVYRELGGKHAYDDYIPKGMMYRTNVFFNFIHDKYDEFAMMEDGVSLTTAYAMWKNYCNEVGVMDNYPRHRFKDELKNYFEAFYEITRVNGKQVRSWYSGFKLDCLEDKDEKPEEEPDIPEWLSLKVQGVNVLDELLKDCKAQYEVDGKPALPWSKVTTTLKDLDTSKVHYILPPDWLWMADFDLKNEFGEKDAKLNLEAASKWPRTYAEFSKSGAGVHLYYRYSGDLNELKNLYAPDIEVKIFNGKAAIRRKVSKCNSEQISTISSGLPKKETKKKEATNMVDISVVEFERYLTNTIRKAIRSKNPECKDPIPGCEHTKPSIDFIKHVLDDAYASGKHYDVSHLRKSVYAHAISSTNNKRYCTDLVRKMKWYSEDVSPPVENEHKGIIAFFDCEVFQNVNMVNWKTAETFTPDQFDSWKAYLEYYVTHHKPVVRLILPKPEDINELLKYDLVGFNCRKYDNHIIHAMRLGYSPKRVYEEVSMPIISGNPDGYFREAWDYSMTDIFDFSSKKQSLKKFEIDLGFHHKELGMDWTKPVPEERWAEVAEYCDNDVLATELLFWSPDRQADWDARQILVDLANGGVGE